MLEFSRAQQAWYFATASRPSIWDWYDDDIEDCTPPLTPPPAPVGAPAAAPPGGSGSGGSRGGGNGGSGGSGGGSGGGGQAVPRPSAIPTRASLSRPSAQSLYKGRSLSLLDEPVPIGLCAPLEPAAMPDVRVAVASAVVSAAVVLTAAAMCDVVACAVIQRTAALASAVTAVLDRAPLAPDASKSSAASSSWVLVQPRRRRGNRGGRRGPHSSRALSTCS